MTKTVEQAISELMAEIAAEEAATDKKKESVNTLCAVVERPPAYVLKAAGSQTVPTSIRSDQFYGQPLASAVRTILEMRRQQNLGAASVGEIYDALVLGGYLFNTKSEDVSKNSLRNSLAKNTTTFHKLPNGRFGMLSWYPKAFKPAGAAADEPEEIEAEEEEKETAATEKVLRRL